MRFAALAALAVACCAPTGAGSGAPATIGAVCVTVAEAACARAAACQPDQAAAYGDCVGDFVSVCCADLCAVASPFPAEAVDDCADGYGELSCALVTSTVPAECDRLRSAP